MLGITADAIEIGLYTPAVVIEGYYYTIATAVNGLFLPRISKYIADKKEENIASLMIKVGKYQLIVLGLIFVGFVCVGKGFMVEWMNGSEYEKSYYCALIILFPTLISATQQIANTTVIAKKLVKYNAICNFKVMNMANYNILNLFARVGGLSEVVIKANEYHKA